MKSLQDFEQNYITRDSAELRYKALCAAIQYHEAVARTRLIVMDSTTVRATAVYFEQYLTTGERP